MTDFGQNSNVLVISCCDSIISVCLLVIIVNIWIDNMCKVDGDISLRSFNSFPGKKIRKCATKLRNKQKDLEFHHNIGTGMLFSL